MMMGLLAAEEGPASLELLFSAAAVARVAII